MAWAGVLFGVSEQKSGHFGRAYDAGTAPTLGTHAYRAPMPLALNQFALGGRWTIADQAATAGLGATIDANVQARFIYLVLSPPPGRAGYVSVRLDHGPVRTVRVTNQRLYELAGPGTNGRHLLHLAFGEGTAAYAFTFG